MKSIIQAGALALVIVPLMVGDAMSRGGGGGGGRGGGGSRGGGGGGSRSSSASRPSPAVNRSPAASRPAPSVKKPTTQPAGRVSGGTKPVAGAGSRTGTAARPSQGDLQNFLDVPTGGKGAVAGGSRTSGSNMGAAVAGGVAGGAAAEFLQGGGGEGRPAAGNRAAGEAAGHRTGRVEDRAGERGNLAANQPNRIENRQQWNSNRTERRNEVRDQVRENNPRLDFWSDHPNWASWRINRPYRWATWGALTGWVGYGWSDPTSYSYGENVYYDDDSVYYGDQAVASAEEYTQQAEQIASGAAQAATDKAEWMPLGVFALTPDGQASGPDPTLFLQLAISKEGIISGTFFNSSTNSTQTIEGMADKKSQRAAWTIAGKTRPIMETGISNLTQDAAPALVHFADGQTQQWLMVRLEEPAAEGQPPSK